MIGFLGNAAVRAAAEGVVVDAAARFGGFKSIPDLKPFDRSDGADGFGQIGAQFLETGFPDACGQPLDHAFHDASAGILCGSAGVQMRFRKRRCRRVRHIDCVFLRLGQVKTVVMDAHGTDGPGIGGYGDSQFGQNLCRDGACGHASDRFPPGGTSASGKVAEAVFAVVGVIRVSGAVVGSDFAVIPGTLGSISHHQGEGSAGCLSLKDAGENLHRVVFFSGRREP